MKFRSFNIPMLVYQLMRPNYAVATEDILLPTGATTRLNKFYRVLLSYAYPLMTIWNTFEPKRRELYMIASSMPVNGQVLNILNYLFGENGTHGSFGDITFETRPINTFMLPYDDSAPEEDYVYLPYEDSDITDESELVYIPWEGASSNGLIVNIHASLADDPVAYDEFIAYLNALLPYPIKYTIKTYGYRLLTEVPIGYNMRGKTIKFQNTGIDPASFIEGHEEVLGSNDGIGFGITSTPDGGEGGENEINITLYSPFNSTIIYNEQSGGWLQETYTFPDDKDYIVGLNQLSPHDTSDGWGWDYAVITND